MKPEIWITPPPEPRAPSEEDVGRRYKNMLIIFALVWGTLLLFCGLSSAYLQGKIVGTHDCIAAIRVFQ